MSSEILFGDEARLKIKAGIDKLVDVVKVTLGPRCGNVILEKEYGSPDVINDGVSILKGMTLKDPFENLGAEMVKQVAHNTNTAVGDATTTSSILTQAIVSEGLKNVTAGANGMQIRKGIEIASKAIIEELKNISKPVTTLEEKKQVASISANDPVIGEIIANALEAVGDDGVVTIEEGSGFEIEQEVVKGM